MNVRRDPRRRLSTVGGSPWAVMLRHGLIAGAAACLALVVAAAIISGGGAAASAATASAVVAVRLRCPAWRCGGPAGCRPTPLRWSCSSPTSC